MATLLQPHLQEALRRPVEMAWIPGNSGITGAVAMIDAPADGHSVLVASSSLLTAHEFLFGDQLPYRPRRDFAPITRIGETAVLLVVPKDKPWADLSALIAAIRARPGEVKLATSGAGSIGHLVMALLLKRLGLPADAVAYQHHDEGGSFQARAVASGTADFAIAAATGLLPLIRTGTVRALATTGKYRAVWTQELTMVPTVTEAFPQTELDVDDWWGLVARSGTPDTAITAIGAAMGTALEVPSVRAAMTELGTLPVPDPSPADFVRFLEKEFPLRQQMVEASGARLN
ncbi:Bug family tripartite tricarboxylate transporter substrate binding protein [Roseococcus sp. YIM B11640]|uniref:Bug family tripartite tricarboxylate transporter substrate binding protein n=1 Tax=Roseococcus sp. YIM B11640 TaxID=3133973 RepID=UPI003C7E95D1